MENLKLDFNRQNQPETLPLDPASMKMIAFAVSPKYEFGGDGAERKQATTKDGLPKWQIRAVLLPDDGGEGKVMTVNYVSADRPQASGRITFDSMRVRFWCMPERNAAGISIFGTGLRSLDSAQTAPVDDEGGEVEL